MNPEIKIAVGLVMLVIAAVLAGIGVHLVTKSIHWHTWVEHEVLTGAPDAPFEKRGLGDPKALVEITRWDQCACGAERNLRRRVGERDEISRSGW